MANKKHGRPKNKIRTRPFYVYTDVITFERLQQYVDTRHGVHEGKMATEARHILHQIMKFAFNPEVQQLLKDNLEFDGDVTNLIRRALSDWLNYEITIEKGSL